MTPEVERQLREHAEAFLGPCPPSWSRRVQAYLDLLQVWNERLRLTGDRDEERLALHHVADCIHLAPLVPPDGSFVDIGTGGGFPGVPMALSRPDISGTLIESRRRPVTFLREVCRALELSGIRVVEARAEAFAAEPPAWWSPVDVAVSRAVEAKVFLRLAAPLVRRDGIAIVMQTPAVDNVPGNPDGFVRQDQIDYSLPDGTPRRLLLLRRVC